LFVSCFILVIMAIRDPSGSRSVVTVNGLDADNPLHVQNYDNSNSVIIPFKLLGIENYKIWSGAVKLTLQDRNKYGFVDVSQDVYRRLVYSENAANPVRSSLLTRYPLLEVKDAYNVVSMEESHRGVPESSGVTESKHNATSFVAKTFNNNQRQFNNNNNNFTRGSTSIVNRGPNPKLNCKHCGKIGHTIDRCFEIVRFP
nr:ribonuclease H-like domain-containing protein [Tanacetum cinerariifolium]